MSLYLCIFDEDEEIDGIDVGAYSDFGTLHDTIATVLEGGNAGTRFPVFMLRPGCDSEWRVSDCAKLESELEIITAELKQQPPRELFSEWQKNVAKRIGLHPRTLYDCFIDVDGEPLLERLFDLARLARHRGLPILFQ